jgi:hypothetical protein
LGDPKHKFSLLDEKSFWGGHPSQVGLPLNPFGYTQDRRLTTMNRQSNPRLLVEENEDDCGNVLVRVSYEAEEPIGGLPAKMSLELPKVLWAEVIPIIESLMLEDEEDV